MNVLALVFVVDGGRRLGGTDGSGHFFDSNSNNKLPYYLRYKSRSVLG